ncbi:hypothetical protein AB833_23370 [Chromatiales bacterium (ex Bugula neritina AB1)]|nr:hypothetical protein AB833_23370 [Chromatiales bacterium (ex Bugula neritina AB1)]
MVCRKCQVRALIRICIACVLLLLTARGHADSVSPQLQWTRAIDRDDAPVLTALMPSIDIFTSNEKGKTALMAAAKLGDRAMLDNLLQRGMLLHQRSNTGGTTLMYAVLGNKTDMVRYLIGLGAADDNRINAQSTNGWTAAMIAAAKGFDQVLSVLVDNNADPWIADGYGWSPLMRAIDNRHRNVIQYLLSLNNTSLDAQNENGSTALHIAVLSNDIYSARRLIERGANRSIRDSNHKLASDIADDMGLVQLRSLLIQKN